MARMEEQHKEHVEEILGGDSVRKSPKPECASWPPWKNSAK